MAQWGVTHARALLGHPAKVAGAFWAAGTVAILAAVVTSHWSHSMVVVLVMLAGVCAAVSTVHFAMGERMPPWGLHLSMIGATGLITFEAAYGHTDPLYFADHYIWVIVYASLFFSLRAALAQTALAAAAYAALLALRPEMKPVAAWLTVFGTGVVAGAVVLGLVAVLRADAREDSLTSLANRRSWDERLEEEIERARRSETTVSVVMVDLDDFKLLNDQQGHEAGDRLLQALAGAWAAVVRSGGDFIARLGGDEFAVLAPGSDVAGVTRLTQRLQEALPAGMSCSMGAATWNGTETAGELLRRADHAMYGAKQQRRAVRDTPEAC